MRCSVAQDASRVMALRGLWDTVYEVFFLWLFSLDLGNIKLEQR